jgi:hypothetical protein
MPILYSPAQARDRDSQGRGSNARPVSEGGGAKAGERDRDRERRPSSGQMPALNDHRLMVQRRAVEAEEKRKREGERDRGAAMAVSLVIKLLPGTSCLSLHDRVRLDIYVSEVFSSHVQWRPTLLSRCL